MGDVIKERKYKVIVIQISYLQYGEYMDLNHLKENLINRGTPAEEVKIILEYAQNLSEIGVPVIFDIQQFRRLLRLTTKDFNSIYYSLSKQYREIEISKRNRDEFRNLSIPSIRLKYIQRWILDNILYKVPISNYAMGFAPFKSISNNASPHVQKEYILKVDIKDFFPSISSERVYGLFRSMGYCRSVSIVLTNFCTYNNKLPQGAPSSPHISNLLCRKLDIRISILCENLGLAYTRYADDITISGGKKIKSIISLIYSILREEGFEPNLQKSKVIYKSQRQTVTGITVNNKLAISKELSRNIRQEIHFMKKFGVKSHLEQKGKQGASNTKEHFFGLAHYIYMIDKDKGVALLTELYKIDWNS